MQICFCGMFSIKTGSEANVTYVLLQLMPVGTTLFTGISSTDLDNGNYKLVEYGLSTSSFSEASIQVSGLLCSR